MASAHLRPDGRKIPRIYPQPKQADYNVLVTALEGRGWTDADMQLKVLDAAALDHLTAPAYLVRQRNVISYLNVRLLRRDVAARYVGVTHEYVDLAGHIAQPLAAIEFDDHADGANRAQKAARDIALLLEFLRSHPGLRTRCLGVKGIPRRSNTGGRPQAWGSECYNCLRASLGAHRSNSH